MLFEGINQFGVGGHDAVPFSFHVPTEFFQKGPEEDHTIPQRRLQLLYRLKTDKARFIFYTFFTAAGSAGSKFFF